MKILLPQKRLKLKNDTKTRRSSLIRSREVSTLDRPKNKDEFRAEMAEAFAHILEEKGLDWKKEWAGIGGSAPHNGITKANYRGCNAFMLQLTSMIKGYDDPRWVTMLQIMDNDGKYHPKQKWHLKKGSKATYVEYWYPYDVKNKKAMTWE